MDDPAQPKFVSRGGFKLLRALEAFDLDVTDLTCADLGCSTGGFTDCLLQRGAKKVYAVDTGYGVLDWKLRKDPRVVVMERTNALHVQLPEKVQFVTIDASWTRQHVILPAAASVLMAGGRIVTLVKPHYEAEKTRLRKGVLPLDEMEPVVLATIGRIEAAGFRVMNRTESPIKGTGGNAEVLLWVEKI